MKRQDRLNLGCGLDTGDSSYYHVDRLRLPGVDLVLDLDRFPWPWQDNSVTEIAAKHLVEHLEHDVTYFMDECWRILKPGGSLYIETPNAGDDPDLTWADPSHKHFYRLHTWVNYFTLAGVARFHYTDRPWNMLATRVDNGVVIVHCNPVEKPIGDAYAKHPVGRGR